MVLDRFSLSGRTALVTGASSGIGHALAKGLAEAGARVVCAARRKDRVAELAAEIVASGGAATFVNGAVMVVDGALNAVVA